ncbi:MAG: hypothetical protein GC137_04960 [Alphaproteobacteria bacterium]|nr:hypothetical protein [Alphaproteobacteria bacterium]
MPLQITYTQRTMNILAALFVFIPFGFFLAVQSQYYLGGNVSWLVTCALRLLQGHNMSEYTYETNPPMSILIYLPHAALSFLTGLKLPYATLFTTYFYVAVSLTATHFILKFYDFLTDGEKAAFFFSLIVSFTVLNANYFGDREHIMMMGLVPFILVQYAITKDIKLCPNLRNAVLFFGGFCILIKPYYGLLPVVMFLARGIKRKNLSILKDRDFQFLVLTTLMYAAILLVFFQDYLTIILPDVIAFYTSQTNPEETAINIAIPLVLFISFCILHFTIIPIEGDKNRLANLMLVMGLLCFIPYFGQYKGFYNHIVPIIVFMLAALSLNITVNIRNALSGFDDNFKTSLPFAFAALVTLVVAGLFAPPQKTFPKHTEIMDLPVARFLEKTCPHPCRFFVLHPSIEVFNPTAFYTGAEHVSRFPVHWFIPKIVSLQNSGSEQDQQKAVLYKNKYTEFIIKDLERSSPDVILIMKDIELPDGTIFDFVDFFSADYRFQTIFNSKYEKTDQFRFHHAVYFSGTNIENVAIHNEDDILIYDVYKPKQTGTD